MYAIRSYYGRQAGPETVDHYNLQRSIDVLVGVKGNDLGRVARQVQQAVADVIV